ncbi:MAG: hypothetical protein Q9220_005374 [cf. Caloplaca sp. 1 TL-2023]
MAAAEVDHTKREPADLDTTPRASIQTPQEPLAAVVNRRSQIYQKYSSVGSFHPTPLQKSQVQSQIFQNTMANDYARLSERSPSFGGAEINDFEAVFLRLMQSTKTHPGALTLYIEELFGIEAEPQPKESLPEGHAIQVRTLFLSCKYHAVVE